MMAEVAAAAAGRRHDEHQGWNEPDTVATIYLMDLRNRS